LNVTDINRSDIRTCQYHLVQYQLQQTYINGVKQLTEELKAMGVTIDEEELAMAVLNGLPPKYCT
jgi:hypothetical protein